LASQLEASVFAVAIGLAAQLLQMVISFTARGNPSGAIPAAAAFAASHEKISHHPMFRCILRPRFSKRLWSKAGRVLTNLPARRFPVQSADGLLQMIEIIGCADPVWIVAKDVKKEW
jgi:hypothetical protein